MSLRACEQRAEDLERCRSATRVRRAWSSAAATRYLNESDRSKRLTSRATNITSVTGETKLRQARLGAEPCWRRSREVTKEHKIQGLNECSCVNVILRTDIRGWFIAPRSPHSRRPRRPTLSLLTSPGDAMSASEQTEGARGARTAVRHSAGREATRRRPTPP